MFKIEVVAASFSEMAEKLEGLAAVYKHGASLVSGAVKAAAAEVGAVVQTAETKVEAFAEPRKPRGRPRAEKPVTIEAKATDASPPEAPIPVEVPATKPVTIDELRAAIVDYVDAAAVKSGNTDTRRTAFKEFLAGYGVEKIGQLPEAKYAEALESAKQKKAALA